MGVAASDAAGRHRLSDRLIDRRTFLRTSLTAAGALALVSCTKSSKGTTSPKAGAGKGAATIGLPAPRPTLRLASATDLGLPTPFAYLAAPGFALMNYVYDTLLQEDTDGRMLPLLAERYDRSPDGLTYTFVIRTRPSWHDGRPVTADDVVFTFEYFRSQILSPQLVAVPTDVVDVRATADHTVEVRLDRPAVTFESQVAARLPILPRHIWSGITDSAGAQSPDVMIGSGPYRLTEHTIGQSTYGFDANDDYYLGRPFVKRLELKPPTAADLDALTLGEIDMADVNPFGAPDDILAPFRDDPTYGVVTADAATCISLKWNQARGGALADARFRLACVRAIDRDDILQRVTGGNGLPGNAGYLVPGNSYYSAVAQPGYDPTAAEGILDEAGYTRRGPGATRQGPDGRLLSYTLTAVRGVPAVAELVTGALRHVGVDVTPSQGPLPDVLGGADYEMVIGVEGGTSQSSDPDQLRVVYDSTSTAFQHPRGYANPRVDDLVRRQAVTLDVTERKRILSELQAVVATDLPVMPLYYPDQTSVFRASVFDQWSDRGDALTEQKRNFMTGMKSGLTFRPSYK